MLSMVHIIDLQMNSIGCCIIAVYLFMKNSLNHFMNLPAWYLVLLYAMIRYKFSSILYSHSSSRALSSLRDTDANSVVGAYPVMGAIMAGQ